VQNALVLEINLLKSGSSPEIGAEKKPLHQCKGFF
jgi:hypothetical protein